MLNNSENILTPTYKGYQTNNLYDNFPPFMSDGRPITCSYQPHALLNKKLIDETGIKSNWQYRRYLTANAPDIMKYDYVEAANDIGYYKRYQDTPLPFATPFNYPSFVDTSKPKGYENSDMKELYLTREQLDARKVAPVVKQIIETSTSF
jgi:hypothetical protein